MDNTQWGQTLALLKEKEEKIELLTKQNEELREQAEYISTILDTMVETQ